MIRHNFHMALRILIRQGVYAWVGILGLAIGLAVAGLIAQVVLHAAAVDRQIPGVDRLYRIAHEVKVNDRLLRFPLTPGPLAARLRQELAGIESTCRVLRLTEPIALGARRSLEERFLFADPELPRIFALHFLSGSGASALQVPRSLVLTDRAAKRFFGDEPPLGKTLLVAGEAYRVAGVVADTSHQSHLAFDFLASLSSLPRGDWSDRWSAHNFYSYVRLRPGWRAADLQRVLDRLVNTELGPQFAAALGKSFPEFLRGGQRFDYFLQPVAGIYLDSHLEHELRPGVDRRLLAVLALLACLVLAISCFNYVNFATAQASTRCLEVGVRKALGAERGQLIGQFLAEAFMATLAAAAFAAALLWLLHGSVHEALGDLLPDSIVIGPRGFGLVAAGLAALALLAGGYPAASLATLAPRGPTLGSDGNRAGGAVRRVLVVVQFTVAMALLVVTLAIGRQLRFLDAKDLGFQPAGVLVINGLGLLNDRWQGFEQEVRRMPGVVAAAAASYLPGGQITKGYLSPGSSTRENDLVTAAVLEADVGIVEALKLRVVAGRPFTTQESDAGDVVLVTAMIPARLGWATPVGRVVTVGKVQATIRGVLDDVYLESLRHPPHELVVRPLLGTRPRVLAVRIAPGAAGTVLPRLAACWSAFAPDAPFDAGALDQRMAALYVPERRLMRLIGGFAAAAALLACLGIAGLAAYAAAQRTREVGIRKAIGASAADVACLLTRDLAGPVMVGSLLAVPMAWYAAERWLHGFATRTNLPWWLFTWAGLAITFVALAAAGTQSLRAALANPVDSLHHE